MNIVVFYSGISLLLTKAVLLLLLVTDVSFIADKVTISHILTLYISTELFKYFMISQVPDVDKVLGINYSSHTHTHSGQKVHAERKLKKYLKGAFLLLLVTTVYHILIVLMGAKLLDNFEETLMLSFLLAVLSFLPLCFYHGPNLALGVIFHSAPTHVSSFDAMLRQSLYLTVLGAWLGAFVIPLDWDRPWQKWPVPCLFGAVSGYCISHAVSLVKGLIPVSRSVAV